MKVDLKTLTTSSFTQDFIIRNRVNVEGGYVFDPNDLGGETNHGITKNTANEWKSLWTKYNWDGNMKTLPEALAFEIYVKGWWDRLKLDEVMKRHPVLADRLFDWGINAGRQRGVFALQRYLNVCNRQQADYKDIKVDGSIGTETFTALDAYIAMRGKAGLRALLTTHSGMQNTYYVDISESRSANETFTNGWMARGYANDEMYAYLIVNGTL